MSTQAMAATGGVELTAFQMARELTARGHVLSVIATHGGDLEPPLRMACAHVSVHGNFQHTLFTPPQLLSPLDLARWTRSLASAVIAARKARPDIIYANDFFSVPWALATSQVTGKRIVCHLHGCAGAPLGRQASEWVRRVAVFVAPSAFVRDDWVHYGLPSEKIRVISGGVDPEEYPHGSTAAQAQSRRSLGLPVDGFVALFLGRVVPEKGVDVLMDAWKLLDLDSSEAHLLIVGPGHPGYIRALAAGTDAKFFPARADVLTPLHAADVVVVPSQWEEPFGRVVIEAMAAGRPVLAARSGAIPEILTGTFAGNLFEKGDAQVLGNMLRGAITWRDREPDLWDRCTGHVRDRFSLSKRVDELESLFQEVLSA